MKTRNFEVLKCIIRITLSATAWFFFMLPKPAHAQNVVTQWNDIAITQARASKAPGSASSGATSLYVAYVELAVYARSSELRATLNPTSTAFPQRGARRRMLRRSKRLTAC